MKYIEIDGEELLSVNVSENLVAMAEIEYKAYMDKQGQVYDADPQKNPSTSFFFSAFFGEPDEMGGYFSPEVYICENEDAASRIYVLAKAMDYYNRFCKSGVSVKIHKNLVFVTKVEH